MICAYTYTFIYTYISIYIYIYDVFVGGFEAETLAVLGEKLEDVHLSAFQPCGKAWQAAITCSLEMREMREMPKHKQKWGVQFALSLFNMILDDSIMIFRLFNLIQCDFEFKIT